MCLDGEINTVEVIVSGATNGQKRLAHKNPCENTTR
jgi:hypothetical protein